MMKRIIFISYLLFLIVPFCFGQVEIPLQEDSIEQVTKRESKTYIGVKAGYNASTANIYHQFFGYDADIGFNSGVKAGVVIMNFLNPHYGIQMELNYSEKGYMQRFNNAPSFVTDFGLIELPLLVNIYTGKKNVHFFANAGFFVEYVVDLKYNIDSIPDDPEEEDFYPYLASRDPRFGYGYRGGVGVFYDFNFGTLMFEGSFDYSLSNFLDPITLDSGIPNISNHMVIGFTVGYLFSFTTLK